VEVRRHASARFFLDRAGSWLLRAEVENNLILGICGTLAAATPPSAPATPAAGAADAPHFATVEEGGDVVACAIRTPPHKAIISRGATDAIDALAADLADRYPTLAMAFGPEPEVRRFAETWSARQGTVSRRGTEHRLFEVRRVDHPKTRPSGGLRPATDADIPTLVAWIEAFTAEAGGVGVSDPPRFARERVEQGTLFVWDDARVVTMAACMGRTPTGIRITLVYTPPEDRRRGYATACVADLTQRLLDQGHAYCCLFTDLANPTSNNIYQSIGYRPVLDMTDYFLTAEA
jgi:predicted GNAT family acetyltransferase